MAIAGVGAQLRRWNSVSGAWENLTEVNNINGPNKTKDSIETTSLDSTDRYKTFISGFKDGGEVSANINFSRTTYDLLDADFESADNGNYEILIPDDENTSIEFVGTITSYPLNIVPDDKITIDVTWKVSGKPVINSGSGSA